MPGNELLTAAEAAEKLRIDKRTVLKWARENKIQSVKLSRKVVLFTAAAIDDFVRSREHKVELAPTSHQGAGRKMASPTPMKKGGDSRISGESWQDLKKEVLSWD